MLLLALRLRLRLWLLLFNNLFLRFLRSTAWAIFSLITFFGFLPSSSFSGSVSTSYLGTDAALHMGSVSPMRWQTICCSHSNRLAIGIYVLESAVRTLNCVKLLLLLAIWLSLIIVGDLLGCVSKAILLSMLLLRVLQSLLRC